MLLGFSGSSGARRLLRPSERRSVCTWTRLLDGTVFCREGMRLNSILSQHRTFSLDRREPRYMNLNPWQASGESLQTRVQCEVCNADMYRVN
jgi:hypothetical protein